MTRKFKSTRVQCWQAFGGVKMGDMATVLTDQPYNPDTDSDYSVGFKVSKTFRKMIEDLCPIEHKKYGWAGTLQSHIITEDDFVILPSMCANSASGLIEQIRDICSKGFGTLPKEWSGDKRKKEVLSFLDLLDKYNIVYHKDENHFYLQHYKKVQTVDILVKPKHCWCITKEEYVEDYFFCKENVFWFEPSEQFEAFVKEKFLI